MLIILNITTIILKNMKKIVKFILNFFKKIWSFIIDNLKDKTTLIIFLIVFAIFSSPIVLGYILGFIFQNGWLLGIATGYLALWAGPGTPVIPLILAITLGIRKIIKTYFNNKKIDTVLLDIDGTLIDSEKYTISSKINEGKKYGYDIKEDIVINTLGLSKEISKEYFVSIYGENFPYEVLREKRYDYIYDALLKKEVQYKKGAIELVDYLLKHKYKIALVSSSSSKLINAYKEHLDLFKKFKIIITGDDIEKGKPNPDSYLLACKKSHTLPINCLVVEDSKNGILAAKNAKMKSVFIEDYVKVNDEIRENATYILNDLTEIINLLEEERRKKRKRKNNLQNK